MNYSLSPSPHQSPPAFRPKPDGNTHSASTEPVPVLDGQLQRQGLLRDIGFPDLILQIGAVEEAICDRCEVVLLVPVCAHINMSFRIFLTMRSVGWMLILLIVFLRHISFQSGINRAGLDVTLLETGTALVLTAVGQRPSAGTPVSALFRRFGRNSYETYLTHMFAVLTGSELFKSCGSAIGYAPFCSQGFW